MFKIILYNRTLKKKTRKIIYLATQRTDIPHITSGPAVKGQVRLARVDGIFY